MCSRFRSVARCCPDVALAHALFYCNVRLSPFGGLSGTPIWALLVSRFCDTLRGCAERGVRLSLDLQVADRRSWRPNTTSIDTADPSQTARLWAEQVLPALRDHIGIVIKLTIGVSRTYCDVVWVVSTRLPLSCDPCHCNTWTEMTINGSYHASFSRVVPRFWSLWR